MSLNLVTEDMIGKRVSVFMQSGVKNVGKVNSVTEDLVEISFFVDSREKAPDGTSDRREMHVTLRQDRVESVGVLS